MLKWSENCFISSAVGETQFAITDTKLYVPIVTLSIQDNAKLLEQLKFYFKRTINWNKYLSKTSTERKNKYLNYLIDPSFHGVNRIFILSFENENDREAHTQYFLPRAEIKDCNVMVNGKNFLDQPVTNDLKTYSKI